MKETLILQGVAGAAVYIAGGVMSTAVAVGIVEACRWAVERFHAADRRARRADLTAAGAAR